jgi:CBS domain-containing protein
MATGGAKPLRFDVGQGSPRAAVASSSHQQEGPMMDISNPTAATLMTRSVVSVLPETPVREIALILAERSISAVPVVDGAGHVLGVVTEADLVRRLAGLADAAPGWLTRVFADPVGRAERYARTHGAVARDIMTESVVSVAETATAAEIAHIMEEKNIRRVLVLRDGQLAGLVSRADLLRALTAEPSEPAPTGDENIRLAVLEALRHETWSSGYYSSVGVQGGVVTFDGFCQVPGTKRGMHVLALGVPGVRGVVDNTVPMPTGYMAAI